LGNSCYWSVQNLLSSSLLSKNISHEMFPSYVGPVLRCSSGMDFGSSATTLQYEQVVRRTSHLSVGGLYCIHLHSLASKPQYEQRGAPVTCLCLQLLSEDPPTNSLTTTSSSEPAARPFAAEITTFKRYRPHLSRSASKQLTKGRYNEWQKEGKRKRRVISGLRRGVNEICALFGILRSV
jgi:hypothetical protein